MLQRQMFQRQMLQQQKVREMLTKIGRFSTHFATFTFTYRQTDFLKFQNFAYTAYAYSDFKNCTFCLRRLQAAYTKTMFFGRF